MSLVVPLAPTRRAAPMAPADVEVLLRFGGGHRGVFCEVRRRGRLVGAMFGDTVRDLLDEADEMIGQAEPIDG
jgi:hypothetical protein